MFRPRHPEKAAKQLTFHFFVTEGLEPQDYELDYIVFLANGLQRYIEQFVGVKIPIKIDAEARIVPHVKFGVDVHNEGVLPSQDTLGIGPNLIKVFLEKYGWIYDEYNMGHVIFVRPYPSDSLGDTLRPISFERFTRGDSVKSMYHGLFDRIKAEYADDPVASRQEEERLLENLSLLNVGQVVSHQALHLLGYTHTPPDQLEYGEFIYFRVRDGTIVRTLPLPFNVNDHFGYDFCFQRITA